MTRDHQHARMLIVDDDDVDRECLRRLLRKGNAEVEIVEAIDQTSALQLLAEGRVFDCVFLDSRLPDGDGLDLVDRFAKLSTVVFLSGTDDKTVQNEALFRGAKACLGKGAVSLKSLNQTISLHS
jgi:CheY-like chemotaxis protein